MVKWIFLAGNSKAYGQDLQVRKGQILFSGPVDQPYLNIEAIRNPDNTADNVIAGVKGSPVRISRKWKYSLSRPKHNKKHYPTC
ncbi:translocation/assembly module TamB domain-containing protein [Proteus mirabilis]